MKKETVSIIIPSYNMEKYIEKSVRTVQEQSYSELDIIIIDDGSTDNTTAICNKLSENDHRIRVVHKENEGLSAARNDGIELAFGDYICFIDADDGIHPRYVEKLMDAIRVYDCDIAQCNFYAGKSNNYVFFDAIRINTEIINGNDSVVKCYQKDYLAYNSSCTKIYKKKLFNDVRFPIGRLREDEFTTWKIMLKANKIAYLHEYLYQYVARSESIMGMQTVKKHLDGADAFWERAEYLKETGRIIEAVRAAEMTVGEIDNALNMIKSTDQVYDYLCDMKSRAEALIKDLFYGYLFPYSKIPKGSVVAIFGAGKVGKAYYSQLSNSDYSRKIIWVDTYALRNNENVTSIDALFDDNLDYIVIAVSDNSIAAEIRESIIDLGIDSSKIII